MDIATYAMSRNYTDKKITEWLGAYGIRYVISTDTITRLGNAVSKVANANGGANDFNSIMPWAGIRRCNLADNLNVNAYYGDAGYIEDGTNGQCMVEVPAFYYKRAYVDADKIETYISMLPLYGYKLHPWFYDSNNLPVTKKYISAYEGCIYDVSAGAYLLADEQIGDFTVTTGDKLSSIAGAKPCSGKTHDLTIAKSRIISNNRAAKWQQLYFNAVSAIQMLFAVEYASFNSQLKIGQGVVNIADDAVNNQSLNTGATTGLGSLSGKATGTDGVVSISYRGIENFWGNIWSWVDGLNINNGIAYISNLNASFVSDTFTGNYVAKETLGNANGYFSKSALNNNFDHGYLPIQAIGTSTSKYCDYYYQNSVGAFVAQLGGKWNDGANAGAFYWYLYNGSALRSRSIGARLCV
jgi:hypothetical protein